MKIGLITTLDTNIGDDFIREGIVAILRGAFPNEPLELLCINKHEPRSVYPKWHPVHLEAAAGSIPAGGGLLQAASRALASRIKASRFDDCDLIVQCGAPVFWPRCSDNEWAGPIWHDVVGRLSGRIPVLNLAAGACYPWERQPVCVEQPADAGYIRAILGYCRLTTVRDRLARALCNSLGHELPLVPCSAFLASGGTVADLDLSGYVLINYMTGGGHFSWGQEIDPGRWKETVTTLIARLGKRHKLAFLCHDDKELESARELAAGIPCFLPKTVPEYFACVSRAKFGIFNRMHASVAMAGLGIPSAAVCTDTRLLMVAELGLPAYYVNDAGAGLLEEEVEAGLKRLVPERERLLALRHETSRRYASLLRETLSLT